MAENLNTNQISQWANNASSEDLISVGKTIINRISTLDQSSQQRFQREMQNSPTISRLFESTGQSQSGQSQSFQKGKSEPVN